MKINLLTKIFTAIIISISISNSAFAANALDAADGSPTNAVYVDNDGNVGINTTDLDGTPAIGRVTVKGTTADGSTNILVGRDSAESNVFTVNTDGKITSSALSTTEYTTNDTSEIQISSVMYPTTSSNNTSSHIGSAHYIRPLITTGITQSGYEMGIYSQVLRNSYNSSSDENGTLASLYSQEILYGHSNTNTAATPLTTNVFGLYLYPYYKTGTITNLYDLYISSGSSGGTVTNRYAIYQVSGAAKNYFAGNVGIGTTSPDYKLDVLGTIRAQEVKVATGWSDFVFDDDYSLPSLTQVESYVKENKHLPDIPSAAEIQDGGLSVAEMMAKQMQKIEELTLYVIEQNKKMTDQNKQIEKLKEEIAELKKSN